MIHIGIVNTAIKAGVVKEIDIGFIMSCPNCGKNKILKTKENVRRSLKYNKRCNRCCGGLNMLGKKDTDEHKKKKSTSQIKRYSKSNERIKTSNVVKSIMFRPDVRKRHLDALHSSNWLKVKMDKGQLELLEKWNKLGFNFEPNYQVKTDLDLFYIDGYDKNHNIVLEYDSKYHQKFGQRQKDLVRQQKIIEILKPKKFWRYDSINKSFKNVS